MLIGFGIIGLIVYIVIVVLVMRQHSIWLNKKVIITDIDEYNRKCNICGQIQIATYVFKKNRDVLKWINAYPVVNKKCKCHRYLGDDRKWS